MVSARARGSRVRARAESSVAQRARCAAGSLQRRRAVQPPGRACPREKALSRRHCLCARAAAAHRCARGRRPPARSNAAGANHSAHPPAPPSSVSSYPEHPPGDGPRCRGGGARGQDRAAAVCQIHGAASEHARILQGAAAACWSCPRMVLHDAAWGLLHAPCRPGTRMHGVADSLRYAPCTSRRPLLEPVALTHTPC